MGDRGRVKWVCLLVFSVVAANAADTINVFDRDWTVPVGSDWKVEQQDGAQVLHLAVSRGPLPGPRRPVQFALTETPSYGRITVELDVKPLDASLMVVFAYRDPAHFNYLHLSRDRGTEQTMHNGIFHVYGGERVRISSERGPAAFAPGGGWHHVKLTHDAATGVVTVMVGQQILPALQAVDMSLGAGKVGIGSFDETGVFKNVTIMSTGGN